MSRKYNCANDNFTEGQGSFDLMEDLLIDLS